MRLISGFFMARPKLAFAGAVTTLLSALAEIAYPWLLQHGIDAAVGEDPAWSVQGAALSMVGVIIAVVIGHGVTLVFQTLMFSTASFNLRRRLYDHVQRLPLPWLDRHRSGTLAYRVTSDVSALEIGLAELFGDFSFDLLVAIGVAAAMAATDWLLTAMVIGIMATASAVAGHFGDRLPSFKRASQMLAARLAGLMQEAVGATRTIRSFGAESYEVGRLDVINRRMRRLDIAGGLLRAFVTPLWHFAETLGVVVVLWYGGHLVASQSISVGTLVAFIAYLELLAGPINRFGSYYVQFQTCRGVASRINDLLLEPASVISGAQYPKFDGRLVVEDVAFSYPGTERRVFSGLSFTIEAGEQVAIVGPNGTGKSTLFDLLMAFYHPQQGRILSAGINIKDWQPDAWRASIGLMLQACLSG